MIARKEIRTTCAQCGGAASVVPGHDYLQCDYCRGLVFSADNPLNVDRIISSEEQCDQASCPACQRHLLKGAVEGRPVLYCNGCYGLLIRNEHFGAIVRERRARREGCEAEACRPLNTDEYRRRLHCPNCTNAMEAHPYYGPGNVIIDSCPSCWYIWLDHGELRTVERAEGGVEPAPVAVYVTDDDQLSMSPPTATGASQGNQSRVRPQSTLDVILESIFGI